MPQIQPSFWILTFFSLTLSMLFWNSKSFLMN